MGEGLPAGDLAGREGGAARTCAGRAARGSGATWRQTRGARRDFTPGRAARRPRAPGAVLASGAAASGGIAPGGEGTPARQRPAEHCSAFPPGGLLAVPVGAPGRGGFLAQRGVGWCLGRLRCQRGSVWLRKLGRWAPFPWILRTWFPVGYVQGGGDENSSWLNSPVSKRPRLVRLLGEFDIYSGVTEAEARKIKIV